MRNFLESTRIAEQIGDKDILVDAYTNLGATYTDQKDYNNALDVTNKAVKIAEEMGYYDVLTRCYNNIGNIYYYQGNYERALENLEKAIARESDAESRTDVIICRITLGEVLTKMQKYSEAEMHLKLALEESRSIGTKEYIKESYVSLSKLYETMGDYKGAYRMHLKYMALKDSLLNEENSRQMTEIKTKYESERKEKEIELLNSNLELRNLKLENQRITIRYLIGGFGVFLIIAVAAFYAYHQRKKVLFNHQVLETEMKALRSQMNPHFTFNVLNSIQYFVTQNDMESAELYIEKFASLIRMILDQSRKSYITLEQEINMLEIYLELEQMLFEKKIDYRIEIAPDIVPAKLLVPGMLIQPVVENSIKHGLAHREGETIVTISFKSEKESLLCTVTDNGIGREAAYKLSSRNAVNHSSEAMKILSERMDALSAIHGIRFSYKTEDMVNEDGIACGTMVIMELPLKNFSDI
ncbi:MAG: tetratricopeptide repeat protein [Saprospiraceae bacterium]|nr:tetratricopeptide repeat protein [Saprospiraceae bacterium]